MVVGGGFSLSRQQFFTALCQGWPCANLKEGCLSTCQSLFCGMYILPLAPTLPYPVAVRKSNACPPGTRYVVCSPKAPVEKAMHDESTLGGVAHWRCPACHNARGSTALQKWRSKCCSSYERVHDALGHLLLLQRVHGAVRHYSARGLLPQ